jgi:uncharacterized protein (TIGR02001 family)
MTNTSKLAALCGAVGLALLAISGTAAADGYEVAAAPAAADEGRKFTYSFNIGATSDYVFRGISQTDNDPTVQGGIDLTYGMIYVGWWASGIDFDEFGNDGKVEMDWYGGIKPTWGKATFDFGVLYYSYPGSDYDANPALAGIELPYWEFKAGVSGPVLENLTLGGYVYWSPDYFAETGSVWTLEGQAGYTFRKIGVFTPSITGVLGYQTSDDDEYESFNGFSDYWYWNAGLALAVDKLTFDFRYWDTDGAENAISRSAGFSCTNDLCGERFVFSAKVVLP